MQRATAPPADEPDSDFDALYRGEFVRAVRLAHLLTGSNEVAEDIAQEAFVRMRPRWETIERPAAYLTTSITNLCWNWHRARGRDEVRRRKVAAMTVASNAPEHDHLLAIVDALPFRQRTVLVARYWLDLSEADIAVLLGCRPGTVKSLAARALQSMRKQLT